MNPCTVIIPALDEEAAIGPTIDRIKALPITADILVVDDGSTDKTGEIAKQKGATVIRHPEPGGYGRSVKDALKQAKNDTVVIIDADGTYPIEDIPKLLTEFSRGYDMVVGARHGKYYRGTFLKMPARIVLKWLVEFTTGRLIPDINSGLRVFRASDALRFADDLCNGFSFTTTITLIYMLTGKFVHYVPINYGARIGHSKVRIVRDSLRTLQYITEVIATYNPLKLTVLISAFLGLLTIASVIANIVTGDQLFALFALIALTGACVIFAIGIHAHIAASEKRRGA